ncbi:MAG: hypothetical protein QME51_08125, partial [Planctomycetota bacterium]|nr:hypothetical protein [Planctomycetota bacterium]
DKTLGIAKDLQKIVTEKRLSCKIQGKDYVQIEGWQFCLSRLGIVPVVKSVTKVSDSPISYMAEVELRRIDNDQIVGRGFGFCSKAEKSKATFDEYAICSMAQTRAVGKAGRNMCAWLMKSAGFEPTPAEEMDGIEPTGNSKSKEELSNELSEQFLTPTTLPQAIIEQIKKTLKSIGQDEEGIEMCMDLNIPSLSKLPLHKLDEAREWIKNYQKPAKKGI